MIYAPIIIPTLNRITHLKRCVESLEINTGANETEIYISIDYPPSDCYKSGHKEVYEYLKNKELHNGFKAMHVYYQEKNLGVARNTDFLREKVRQKYNCYIATEDDNEFAKNFLQYMNKGLEIFRDDERVLAICGCKETMWKTDNSNVIALQLYSPYGSAMWIDRMHKVNREIDNVLMHPQKLKHSDFANLRRRNRTLFNTYILGVLLSDNQPIWNNGELRAIDTVKSIYMHLTGNLCVAPAMGKSRTWGNDGSGLNMSERSDIDPVTQWPLDEHDEFEYIIKGKTIKNIQYYRKTDFDFDIRNYSIGNEYMKYARNLKANVKADIGYMLLRFCGFNWKKARCIKKGLTLGLK